MVNANATKFKMSEPLKEDERWSGVRDETRDNLNKLAYARPITKEGRDEIASLMSKLQSDIAKNYQDELREALDVEFEMARASYENGRPFGLYTRKNTLAIAA